jgi:ABC-type transport system involved in cytochrome c biogenesis ATPase subunit
MLFTARNLRKSYAAGTPGCSATARVLCGVNLELVPGGIVGVTGGRGSGKTTLVRCVAGLARPDAGALHWEDAARRPRVVALAPAAYACETVRDAMNRACGDPAVDPAALAAFLAELGLTPRLHAGQLSLTSDERARCALAVGLAVRHPLLLLDGTPDALAAVTRPVVAALLARHAEAGGAVLLTGRDRSAVSALAPELHELRDGRLIEGAAPADRRAPARVAEAGNSPLVR